MNEADLFWPEDPGYDLRNKPLPPGEEPQRALDIAQAQLAVAGARRERYGALPGRDPEICAQLNDEITQAQAQADDARQAIIDTIAQPKSGPPLVE